ncbi:WD40 repeat domain-containing protein [Streptomyces albipurpureus]|uniref:WD40 repeat domain-containing protein n=1 Tax=Streptomyces albipurpureus TaxID=2897419 RepID=A0ABT0UJM5_9ACTN|nr:WD40 repeat domain-containing protein [Streptomyces sp. CWNU-1]MCM2388698.1 WD40 repeat domain-containing protein [Streptomyces sp. CWNU-1]
MRAQEWHSSGRLGGLLLRGHELVIAEAWRRHAPAADEEYRAVLTDGQTAFLEASRAAARRRSARLGFGVTATSLALAALASLVVSSESTAVAQGREADSRRLAADANERATADVRRAVLLSAAAFHQSDSAEARESMVRQLTRFNQVRGVIPAGKSGVTGMTLSQDEKLLVLWRADETVEVWDTVAMRSRGTLPGRRMSSEAGGDLSANGQLLGILRNGVAIIVDTRTMKELHQADLRAFGTTGIFSNADLTRDGRTLMLRAERVHGEENYIWLWDVAAAKVIRKVRGDLLAAGAYGTATETWGDNEGPSTIRDLADPKRLVTMPPGTRFLGLSESGAPVVIDSGTVKVLSPFSTKLSWTMGSGYTAEKITSNGRFLAVSRTAEPGRYEVWDLRKRKRISRVLASANVGGYGPETILSGDGSRLAVANTSFDIYRETSQYSVYNTLTGRREAELPGPVTVLGPGRLMAGAATAGTVTLWDRGPSGSLLTRHKTPVPVAPYIAVAARASTMAVFGKKGRTAGSDGTVRLLRRSDGRLLRTIRLAASPFELALSPDGKLLAVAEADGREWERQAYVEVFDTATGRRLKHLMGGGIHSPRIRPSTLMFSPDGSRLYLGEVNGVSVYEWHTDTWRRGHRYGPDGDTGAVAYSAVSPDGAILAVGGGQKRVQLWDTATGKRLGKPILDAVAVGFRPDGLLVTGGVGGGDPAVRLWEPYERRLLAAGPDVGERTLGLAVSPDGQTVASATGDQRLLLWDSELDRNIPIEGVTVPDSSAMAFTGEGDRLVIAQPGESLSLLVGPRRWLSALCRIAGGPMTPAEWQAAAPGERYRRIC